MSEKNVINGAGIVIEMFSTCGVWIFPCSLSRRLSCSHSDHCMTTHNAGFVIHSNDRPTDWIYTYISTSKYLYAMIRTYLRYDLGDGWRKGQTSVIQLQFTWTPQTGFLTAKLEAQGDTARHLGILVGLELLGIPSLARESEDLANK